jgi:uncharacterized protein YfaQ (DUF2300 family)
MHAGAVAGCDPLPVAERWLRERVARWRTRLVREPGFEAPPAPTVCRLARGHPYADANRARLYVRGVSTPDDRVALAHEYLHLAFRWHPRGMDETSIERLARELVQE